MSAVPAVLLAQPRLSIVSSHRDTELARIQDLVEHRLLVDGRGELEQVLGALLAAVGPRPTPKTLDLIGHSSPGKALLLLGDWTIDASNATVVAFFRELAEQEVMPRLGVRALRLLGCLTADSGQGRHTIQTLAEILDLEVYGTNNLIFSSHYNGAGFAVEREFHLVSATELRSREVERQPRASGVASVQVLDVDLLPAAASLEPSGTWPHRLADEADMASVLRLVRRREGAGMPGLLSMPACELLFPSPGAGLRRMQVVLDGTFVRVYPTPDGPAILYPVDDARALATLIAGLPLVEPQRAQRTPIA